MPQIARLLSPPGAMNQQGQKPNVENTAIASYANQLKNTSFSYNPIKTQIKPNPGIFSRLLGAFGLGENKARMKLNDILTVLQKMDERKERDYQLRYLQQEIEKEKDELRHKELVNLFVQATNRRKRAKRIFSKKPMAGSISSTLLMTGGAIALLSLSSNAFANIKKSIDTDLILGVKKEFEGDISEIENMFDENIFKREYENIRNFFKTDFEALEKVKQFVDKNFSGFLKDQKDPLEDYEKDARKLLDDLDSQTKKFEGDLQTIDTQNQSLAETKRLQERASTRTITPSVTPVEPQKPAPTATATPVSPQAVQPMHVGDHMGTSLVRRATSLTAEGEVGKREKNPVTQIVESDPEPGHKSYGLFGMNTKSKTIHEFIKMFPQFGLQDLQPGTKEFDERWKSLGQTRQIELQYAQMQWYADKVINPLQAFLLRYFPEQIARNEKVLIYMSDRRVQYGFVNEKEALKYATGASSPEELIRKISEFDRRPENIRNAFPTAISNSRNPEGFIQGLINRVDLRERKSLNPESINMLGSIVNERSIQLSGLIDQIQVGAPSGNILINNNNVVSQKRIAMTSDPMHNAHPLVG